MPEGSQFIDIILFAMVALFLGLRLRSVLGRRTGNERPPGSVVGGTRTPSNDTTREPARDPAGDTTGRVIDITPRMKPAAEAGTDKASGLSGLEEIHRADPSFDPEGFAGGARAAFEMIVTAFAKGDENTLRPLLSDEVFQSFAKVIHDRRTAGEVCGSELVKLDSAEIEDASLAGRLARVTVRFVSRQLIVIRDAKGEVVEGDPDKPVKITDVWSFERDLRARDPNWRLVATRAQED